MVNLINELLTGTFLGRIKKWKLDWLFPFEIWSLSYGNLANWRYFRAIGI